MPSLTDAIAEARSAQLEERGMGVGVQIGDGDDAAFVQWTVVDGAPLVLDRVEIQPASTGANTELANRGFRIDPEYGLMAREVTQSFSTEEELIAYIAELLRLVGAADGTELIAFP